MEEKRENTTEEDKTASMMNQSGREKRPRI